MHECQKGVNIVLKRRSLVDWPRRIHSCTYFHKGNMSITIPCFFLTCHLCRNKKEKKLQLLQHRIFFEDRANKSSGLWQTALHRILFFPLFHMTSQPQSFFFTPPSFSFLPDYISLCLIISFQLHTMKDYDAAAARTAESLPSKIFLLMLLTCTAVYVSA